MSLLVVTSSSHVCCKWCGYAVNVVGYAVNALDMLSLLRNEVMEKKRCVKNYNFCILKCDYGE